MSESDSSVTSAEVTSDVQLGPGRRFWLLLGLSLPFPGGIAGVFVVEEIREPCRQIFCGVGDGLLGLTGGYFLGWLLSAVLALGTRSPEARGENFRATVKGAAILPGLVAFLLLIIFIIAAVNQLDN